MHINLISDTITQPDRGMREAMMQADLGDDVFGTDPSVNRLQNMLAEMFGKEEALYCASGTMSNQIGIKMHTKALDELICEVDSHVYQYETGGYAFNSGLAIKLIEGKYGKFTAEQLDAAINPDYDWLPSSSLVVLENSTNKGGGNYYTIDEIKPIAEICRKHSLKFHLDGARLFNVLVETGESTRELGQLFDSISICLSKGLGAPVGSVLIGNKDDIRRARRIRKVMGGSMRQAGIIAAAGIYALENNIERLRDDNRRARQIRDILNVLSYVEEVKPVKTNIVIFKLRDQQAPAFVQKLGENGVSAHAFGPQLVRFVTHMHFDDEHLENLEKILKSMA